MSQPPASFTMHAPLPLLVRIAALTVISLSFICARSAAQTVLGAESLGDRSGASTPVGMAPTVAKRVDSNLPMFRWGDVAVRPHLHYGFVHATGLRAPQGETSTTNVHTYSAGVLADLGSHWQADYTAAWVHYSEKDFRDSLSHFLRADGRLTRPDFAAAFGQRYSRTDSTLVETGRQTKRERSDTMVSASFSPMTRTTASVSIQQQLAFVERLADIHQWTLTPSFSYEVTDKVSAGMSVAAGYVLVYDGSDIRYLNPSANASWRISRRTSAQVSGGWNNWRFVSGNGGNLSGASYSAALSWSPLDSTAVSVGASRGFSATHYRDRASRSDTWSAGLQQRLFQHVNLSLGVSESRSRQVAAVPGHPIVRVDRFRSYNATLGTTLMSRISVGTFYRYARNRASSGEFRFSSRQVGVHVGVRF